MQVLQSVKFSSPLSLIQHLYLGLIFGISRVTCFAAMMYSLFCLFMKGDVYPVEPYDGSAVNQVLDAHWGVLIDDDVRHRLSDLCLRCYNNV